MIFFAQYPVEAVHAAMDEAASRGSARGVLPDGKEFKTGSHRLVLFKTKGVVCTVCGIEGEIYVLESHSPHVPPHLNLYAVKENGKRVLMTKDHTIPKSKGGRNQLENYTTMCSPCNGKKSDKLETA